MKLTVTMIAADESKTSKSFDKVPDATPDAMSTALLNAYADLTTAVIKTGKKVVTTDLDLDA